ncbi:hypothetical protein U1839_18110 [Sphingomonas sp. RT2P30]|uniref:imm11 family protein n=1 Tax=Parasphingomonas halimpatiens TaxID=3096162 RepID=UPI002FCCB646
MVWGMVHPPGSNGFYLEGDFEGQADIASDGWRKRLARHFVDEMSPTQQAIFEDERGNGAHWYACHAVNKFSLRREFFAGIKDPSADPIQSHEIPRYFRATGNCGNLASLATFSGPVLTVDEPMRSFIEWLEPGVHQFFPIEVRRSRGAHLPDPRHLLVVEQRLDSFSEERSDKASFRKSSDQFWHSDRPAHVRGLAFRKADMSNAHLWQERRIGSFLLCFSDRLQAEIADAGLRIPRHYPMIEV